MSKEVSDIIPNLSMIRGKPSWDWWHQWAQSKSSLVWIASSSPCLGLRSRICNYFHPRFLNLLAEWGSAFLLGGWLADLTRFSPCCCCCRKALTARFKTSTLEHSVWARMTRPSSKTFSRSFLEVGNHSESGTAGCPSAGVTELPDLGTPSPPHYRWLFPCSRNWGGTKVGWLMGLLLFCGTTN